MAVTTLGTRARAERSARRLAERGSTASGRTLISTTQLNSPHGKVLYRVALGVVLGLSTLIFLGPLYWLATGGFKSSTQLLSNPPTILPTQLKTEPFTESWDKLGMARLLWNTVYYAFGAMLFQLVFCVAAAYALSKLRPVFGNAILGLMLASMMIPAAVLVVPQYITITDLPVLHLNLINSPWAIWLPTVANAFNIFLLKRFFDNIPDELLDAAAIDGAGSVRILLRIVLPMSRPVLAVISIFAVVAVWKDYLWPLLVVPDHETLNVGLQAASNSLPVNTATAGLFMASVPTIVFFLFFQRNIIAGLTAGATKG